MSIADEPSLRSPRDLLRLRVRVGCDKRVLSLNECIVKEEVTRAIAEKFEGKIGVWDGGREKSDTRGKAFLERRRDAQNIFRSIDNYTGDTTVVAFICKLLIYMRSAAGETAMAS